MERRTPTIKSHLIGWKIGLTWIPPIENYQVDIIGYQVTTFFLSVIACVYREGILLYGCVKCTVTFNLIEGHQVTKRGAIHVYIVLQELQIK